MADASDSNKKDAIDDSEDVDPGKEEEEEEDDKGFVPGKQIALKEQLEMDKDDESLTRWKEKLLGSINLADGEKVEPEVEFRKFIILVEDRSPIELPIPSGKVEASKETRFTLKEGVTYRLKFEFTVRHEILLGLVYSNKVYRLGRQVDKSKVMLGAYGPQEEPYTFVTEEETAPHGMLVRGHYTAQTVFSDDDGKKHLEFAYSFDIKKDWD
eukprot:TRINITY_DN231_c0_g1_i1.p1 TRINITY_DN231_c0_g1~~TRINITY_DN231_c0_g1_i1.p1  ORF type:complete len:212 (-),score=42.03 TRINITY_DN231_c0_g1_i1:238-873(-)